MALDPEVAAYYGERLLHAPAHGPTVAQARLDADAVYHDKDSGQVPVYSVWDREIPGPDSKGLPIRIYMPFAPHPDRDRTEGSAILQDAQSAPKPTPLMIYFHGGGFVMHNIASHDALCRKLSLECRCPVISVGYRLAPEFPYPACIQDGCAALKWAAEQAPSLNADPQKLILAGDSAGATISAAVSLLARDSKVLPPVALQVLCYGTYGAVPADDSESVRLFGNGGFVLPRSMMDWCMSHYIPADADPEDPFLYPGKAPSLRNMPPTLSITAEYDPLRDDGEAFGQRLSEEGNQVISYRAPGMMHGFLLLWQRFQRSRKVICKIAQEVKKLHDL